MNKRRHVRRGSVHTLSLKRGSMSAGHTGLGWLQEVRGEGQLLQHPAEATPTAAHLRMSLMQL